MARKKKATKKASTKRNTKRSSAKKAKADTTKQPSTAGAARWLGYHGHSLPATLYAVQQVLGVNPSWRSVNGACWQGRRAARGEPIDGCPVPELPASLAKALTKAAEAAEKHAKPVTYDTECKASKSKKKSTRKKMGAK
ncbi:MAG: hypothetical protein ACOC9P_01045 [bacterium]